MNQKELAKIAGVSSATISRVINDEPNVKPETKEYIKAIIQKYNYVTNINARNLRASSSKTVGFLISNFNNPFFVTIYQGIESICRQHGYIVIVGITNERAEDQEKAIDLFLSYQVSGIIGSFVDVDMKTLNKLQKFKKNVISLDREFDIFDFDTIVIDNEYGGVEQVNYLYSLGHKKIAVIYGKLDSPGKERLNGFEKGMAQNGLGSREEYKICGNYNEQDAYYATIKLLQLKDPPTAILVHNNLMCIGAYKALKDLKIGIPKDVSLIGFDNFEFADYLEPGITLINRPINQMGEMAGEMLFDRLKNKYNGEPRRIILPVKLKINNSCTIPRENV